MTEVQRYARPTGRGAITQWLRKGSSLMLLIALLAGAGAVAAVLAPTPPPIYITSNGSFDTLEKAEAAIRSSTAYYGAADQLEHVQTVQMTPTTLRMQYWLRKRPANTFYEPMFYADLGIYGQGKGDCNVPASDPASAYNDWCGSESTLIGSVQRTLQTKWPGCTIAGSSMRSDYSATPSLNGVSSSTRGTVNFFFKGMTTTANCQNGTTKSHNWSLQKHKTLYCSTGFYPVSGNVTDATLQTANLCQPRNGDIAWINVPIQQCGSCAGSRNPIYPATGEKQRAESDFTFAGHTFTRHYRSLRQFRNNRSFAVAWNHTWSDRIINGTQASPYVHLDEAGNYESYALLSGNRYRGENSVDRMLERVNANGIGWRLRMPDGEVRDFDLAGYLTAVRNPSDPLNDIAIAYSDNAISTVTDAQGRMLKFEYRRNLLRRIVLPDQKVVAYDYNDDRDLTNVTYPGNVSRQYHYNEDGLAGAPDQRHLLTGITAEDGRRYASFSYDARGRATSSRMLGTPNEVTTVTYPTEDNASLVSSSGDTNEYTILPGTYRRVIGIKDGSGTERRDYNAEGRIERQVDRLGNITEYTYQDGFRRTVTTGVGTDEERKTETIRNLTTGLVTEQRAYDKAGTLLVQSTWTYNARNQVTATASTDPKTGEVRSTATTYCEIDDVANNRCPVVGLVKSTDGPRSDVLDVTRYEYRMADASSCSVTPENCPYRKGDLWRATNAADHVVEILRRDASGRILSQRDANGVVTDTEYDPRGRPVANKVRGADDGSEADDRISRVEYYPKGMRYKTIHPDGTTVRFYYDAVNRLIGIKDDADNVLSYTLDESGRPLREEIKDAAGVPLWHVSRTFNTLGQLAEGRDAYENGTVFAYDKEGNKNRVTDALGHVADYDYDAHGRILRMVLDKNGIAAGTTYRYDALDNLKEVVDPAGLVTSYDYNAFGELVHEYSPDTGHQRYTYDSAGNMRTRKDARDIVTTYSYDALNRLIGVSYPNSGKNEAYVYDEAHPDCLSGERSAKGLVGKMTDASGETGYCYDRYGNVTRKLQMTQGLTYVLRYLHTDPKGRLPGQDYALQNPPPGNQMVGWTYPDGTGVRVVRDAPGRSAELRVTLTNGQTKILLNGATYYPFGPVARWTYGNGRVLRRSVNENYQPGFVEDTSSGGINEGYWFNAVGNLESLQYANQGAPSRRRYAYDGLNRLTHVRDDATDSVLQEYAYDATGNRTKKVESGVETLYTYGPARHRLTQIGTQGRQYDEAGNTTRIEMTPTNGGGGEDGPPGGGGDPDPDPSPINPPTNDSRTMNSASAVVPNVRVFEYDDTNRMRAVRHDGVIAMSYLYNGIGERVHRSGALGSVVSVYDQMGHWVGDYDLKGQPIQQVIWLDDLPVGLLVGAGAGQKLYYIEADALGTPRVVIDPDRNVAVWRWDLAGEAFGDGLPNEDVDGDGVALVFDMRFQGQRFDSATGLNYNYMRDYDSSTGRYVQSDPIGLAGGVSTFGYASGRPMNLIDRYGMDGTCPVAPLYNPSFWNSSGIRRTNNCYSYAWDRPENPEGQAPRPDRCRPQPGGFKCDDPRGDNTTCQKIIAHAIRDGMKRAKKGECAPCMRKVFLVMGNARDGSLDYHWYRQDADGMWSHKPGNGAVTNQDASQQLISNPETANRNYIPLNPDEGVNYSKKCGYLCIPM